jgi:hypothetical protein
VRPPFAPDWIPDRVLVANTIAFEVLIAVAIYWLVVRRAERKRRALAIFLGVVAVVGLVETLGGIEILGEPSPRFRTYEHVIAKSGDFAIFRFEWGESPILGRISRRSVELTHFAPGVERQAALPPDVFAEIWPIVLRDPHLRARVPSESQARGRALWKALCASPLAKSDAGIAAIVSRAGE